MAVQADGSPREMAVQADGSPREMAVMERVYAVVSVTLFLRQLCNLGFHTEFSVGVGKMRCADPYPLELCVCVCVCVCVCGGMLP